MDEEIREYNPSFPRGFAVPDQNGNIAIDIDSEGVFLINLELYLPDEIKFFPTLDDFMFWEGDSIRDIENRLSFDEVAISIEKKDHKYKSMSNLMETGYDGLSYIVPIAMTFFSNSEFYMRLVREKKPDFVIPSIGATGGILVDNIEGNYIIKENIKYPYYLLYIDGSGLNLWDDIEGIEERKNITFYERDLSIFEDFLSGIDTQD